MIHLTEKSTSPIGESRLPFSNCIKGDKDVLRILVFSRNMKQTILIMIFSMTKGDLATAFKQLFYLHPDSGCESIQLVNMLLPLIMDLLRTHIEIKSISSQVSSGLYIKWTEIWLWQKCSFKPFADLDHEMISLLNPNALNSSKLLMLENSSSGPSLGWHKHR